MGGLIHVGAWHGLEYLDDRSTKRRLMLFEPQAKAFAALERNFANAHNVEIYKLALGASEGTVTMNTSHPDHSSSLLRCVEDDETPISFGGTEEVEMSTLDRIVDGRRGWTDLRLDTQGYELEVLLGGVRTLERIKRVEAEIHDPNTYRGAATLPEVDDFLVAHGFECTRLDQPGRDDLADVVYER